MLKKLAHDLAEEKFKPRAKEWDEREEYPREHVKILAEHGLLGITVDEEYGGSGLGALEGILVIEEIARVCPATAFIVFESSVGPVRVITNFGTEEQKRQVLSKVCAGDVSISVAISEPEAGTGMTDMTSSARLEGDHYVLNGRKCFISGAGESELYLVYARMSEKRGAKGIGGILVEKGTPGFSFGKLEKKLGLRGHPQADLIFEDCLVPRENLVVKEGEFPRLMQAFNVERCGNATMALGIAQGAFEEALRYSQERKQFGREICEFQGIQWMLADMAIKVDAARLLIYRAVTNAGKGFPSALEASMAKTYSNEMAIEVTNQALQIFGGYGYTSDFPLERMFRDARAWAIAGGTVQIQRVIIASQLLNRHFDQRRT